MDDNHAEHDKAAEERILKDVEEYGCHIGSFPPSAYLPAFAYSIGLFKNYNHPEIISFGLPVDLLHHLVEEAHQRIKAGHKMEVGKNYADFLQDYDITFLAVSTDHQPDWFGYGHWFYNSWDFPCIQLVWPDKSHRFPWDEDFDPRAKFNQVLLDRNADFKFRGETNVGTIASKDFFKGLCDITVVVHDQDGQWMFLHEDALVAENTGIYALSSVVKMDKTLNEIFYLEFGKKATREKRGGKWVVVDFLYDEE